MSWRDTPDTRKLEESIEATLKECLDNCLICFRRWDLPQLCIELRTLRRIISIMLDVNKFKVLHTEFKEWELIHREYSTDKKNQEKQDKFFNESDKLYISACQFLKEDGRVFSKKEYHTDSDDEAVEVD